MRHILACRRGFTIVEVLVASSVFLLILGVLVSTFYMSTNTMMKGTSQAGMLRDAQAFGRKLSNAIQYGSVASLTIAADESGMSLLTSDNVNGKFRYDPALSTALWSDYQVFYYDSTAQEVRNPEISVIGSPEEATPGPIENFGSAQPLNTYFTGGKPVLRNVTAATFREPIPGLVRVDIDMARDDSRSDGPETFTFSLARNFRN